MRDTFPFLARLGLQPGAEAKEIRRAYARELKKIDQETDPSEFQQLREAYENALRWHEASQIEHASAPARDEEPEPVPEPEDPYELAALSFQWLQSGTDLILERAESSHVGLWKIALRKCLDDDRLLNLQARILFEEQLVRLLASGWQPGHESLFQAANEVFEWERDRRRILQFGEAGARLDKAIDEWKLFESMTPDAIASFRQLLNLVSITREPTSMIGRSDFLLFHQMASRFYSWLSLTVEREALENWREAAFAESQRDPVKQNADDRAWIDPSSESIWRRPIIALPIAFMFIGLLFGFLSMVIDARTPKNKEAVERNVAESLVPPRDEEVFKFEPDKDGPPTQAQLDAVQRQVYYIPGSGVAPGVLRARYHIQIDASGKVVRAWKLNASRDPLFDDAVESALVHTKVFKPENQGKFRAWFDYTVR